MIIDPRQARDDLPKRDRPMTKEEYIEVMEKKGFHFTDETHFHDNHARYVFREIDKLDGCVYDCPLYPGVWSDWCSPSTCDLYENKTDEMVCCREPTPNAGGKV